MTLYHVRYRSRSTGKICYETFTTAFNRIMFIIANGPYCSEWKEWTEETTEETRSEYTKLQIN